MLEIGLTGGMGSGKSTVALRLAAHGAVVLDADRIVREVQAPGQPVFDAIVAAFGAQVVGLNGDLDRAAIAQVVFADAAELHRLNSIVHPAVIDEMTRRRQALATTDTTVVLDIPLLVESRYSGFGGVVVIDVAVDTAVKRLIDHRGFSEDDARARIAKQASRAERLTAADFVIDNNADLDALHREIDACWDWIGTLPRPEPSDTPVIPLRSRSVG